MSYGDKRTPEAASSQYTDGTVDSVTLQILLSCKILAIILQAYASILAPYSVAVTLRFLSTLLIGINGRDVMHYWLDEMGIVGMVIFYSLWRHTRR